MPSYEELYDAFLCHPHGCGVVSSNGVYWRGFDFEQLIAHLDRIGKDDSCIIHFRYATHGSQKVSNCHPFKCGDIYFAHNGVLPVRPGVDMTDSETEFLNVLAPAAKVWGLGSPTFSQIVSRRIYNSKFAFMKDGRIYLYGRFLCRNGVYYSNLNHISVFAR